MIKISNLSSYLRSLLDNISTLVPRLKLIIPARGDACTEHLDPHHPPPPQTKKTKNKNKTGVEISIRPPSGPSKNSSFSNIYSRYIKQYYNLYVSVRKYLHVPGKCTRSFHHSSKLGHGFERVKILNLTRNFFEEWL